MSALTPDLMSALMKLHCDSDKTDDQVRVTGSAPSRQPLAYCNVVASARPGEVEHKVLPRREWERLIQAGAKNVCMVCFRVISSREPAQEVA